MDNSTRSEEVNSIEEQIEEIISNECISSSEKVAANSSYGELQLPDLRDNNFFEIDQESLHGSSIMHHFEARHQRENVSHDNVELLRTNARGDINKATSLYTEKGVSFSIDKIVEGSNGMSVRSLDIPTAQLSIENRNCRSPYGNFHEEKNELEAKVEPNTEHQMPSVSNATLGVDIKKRIQEEKSIIWDDSDKAVPRKMDSGCVDDDDVHISLLKQRIRALDNVPASVEALRSYCATDIEKNSARPCKPVENVSTEFNRVELEDITEESNKSAVQDNDNTSNDIDSIVSLNMIQALENKIKDLQEIVVGKDVCLASLNMQIETFQQKEPYGLNDIRETSKELPPSGRDSSSLITSSTEYRTLQGGCGNKIFDFHNEIVQRDVLIDKLTVSLQQSMNIREQLQQQSEKLSTEVQQLRKQLSEALDVIKRPYWPRYQESVGQRLSEISIDLISESDEDLDRPFLTDTEEKVSISTRNSKERQMNADYSKFDLYEPDLPVTKQIEQFQKYLNPDELRIFFMVQKKFDDFLSQEIEKLKMKHDNELKASVEKLKTEDLSCDSEVNRLRQLLVKVKDGSTELDQVRQELITIHAQEMENLRTYFEKKCSDLEKHYSEEIFSLKTQRNSIGSSSDVSDQTSLPEEFASAFQYSNSKKRIREELHRSPIHKGITPGSLVLYSSNESGNLHYKDDKEGELSSLDARNFYQEKIRDITSKYEETIKNLSKRLKKYESKYADDEFMALLSESTTDDHHWPPELILLREKFTAKSQLEIAQLQIKHEEEMFRLKNDFERQLTRKMKRNSTFDLNRDLDQIITERNKLRELSNTLRRLLCELVKCVNVSESELNTTLIEEICKTIKNPQHLNPDQENFNYSDIINISSTEANQRIKSFFETRSRLIPNTSAILSLIENPFLIEFITTENNDTDSSNLRDCFEKLKTEANHLLQLSENILKNKNGIEPKDLKGNDCEEDDGLKFVKNSTASKELRTQSLNGSILENNYCLMEQPTYNSLPPDVRKFFTCNETNDHGRALESEMNFQMHKLQNRLVKSETDRQNLQDELNATIEKNNELGLELIALRMQLKQLDSQRESLSQAFGTNYANPAVMKNENCTKTLSLLQEKARNFLSTTCKPMSVSSTNLLQLIEDFCRESDKVLEEGKKEKDDLQSQIIAADKQLKATRKFLEDQAAERELERDEFIKEIERLKLVIREKEKDRASLENASKEAEQMEKCINDYKQRITDLASGKDTLELELKASIDKIFVLREIISELETQIETKSLSEHVLLEKVKDLDACIASHAKANTYLENELESFKSDLGVNYAARQIVLQDQLSSRVPQEKVFEGVLEQLKEMENALDQKLKHLELLHQGSFSNSYSVSRSEDVSFPLPKLTEAPLNDRAQQENTTEWDTNQERSALLDALQRVAAKLAKHTRSEEAAFKKFSDLEANFGNIRTSCTELQNERDELQERMSEQQSRVALLQSKLDEQRYRADEIQRQGSSELMIKIHDMKNEIFNLKETLSSRDKQLSNLKNQLEQSKVIIDRQEAELSLGFQGDRTTLDTLQAELKLKEEEIKIFKERIKNDMINKLALPDLMETMLADKNEEIDHLKESLETKELQLNSLTEKVRKQTDFKTKHASDDQHKAELSARTLSDIGSISEYDEPDVIRKAVYEPEASINFPTQKKNYIWDTMTSSKVQPYTIIRKLQNFPSSTCFPGFDKDVSSSTAFCMPRHLNFSDSTNNSQTKHSSSTNSVPFSDVNSIIKNSIANDIEKNHKNNQNSKNSELVSSVSADVLASNDGLSSELNEKMELLKNRQDKYEEQTHQLRAWEKELEMKNDEIDCLLQGINSLSLENNALEIKIEDAVKKSNEYSQQLQLLKNVVLEKDEFISKQEKDLANYMQNEKLLKEEVENLQKEIHNSKSNSSSEEMANIRKELESVRAELSEKVLMYEKCVLDLEAMEKDINSLRRDINKGHSLMNVHQDMVLVKRFEEVKKKLTDEEKRRIKLEHCNLLLEAELEKLGAQNTDPKPFSLDEIAERVEKELNYSAQLDSNILKAIESEEENNFSNKFQNNVDKVTLEDTWRQLQVLQSQLNIEKENCGKMTQLLNEEKLRSQEIQQQDADIIEAIRLQLQTAMDREKELYNVLDAEREKCERLVTQTSIMQRTEARKYSFMAKPPPDSPKNMPHSPKPSEVHKDSTESHKNETKLLTSQIEREKERMLDLQRALEREKNRFEVELNERIQYAQKLKQELEKIYHEKKLSEQEVQHLRERLVLAAQEIECLEGRISILQEADTRQLKRRDRERDETVSNAIELHDLKLRNSNLEKERDLLNQTVHTLRCDLERGAQREAKFAEALINTGVATNVPEQFLQKLKEMNYLLIENTKENKQMAETLLRLTVERKDLQKKCEDLEYTSRNRGALTLTEKLKDLEERANHLFGKYLRVESHRKALVHQKRYLLIVLQTYQDNETRALKILNDDKKPKRVSFKSVALIVVAIQRMKFIVKRWQTGKKVASKSVLNVFSTKRLTADYRQYFATPV